MSGSRLNRPLRVCYFGTYRAHYARNRLMIERLRRRGVEVVECHAQLWHGIEDRVQAVKGGWLNPAFWWRVLRAYWLLLRRYRHVGEYDVLIVGYPGHFDVFLARLLTRMRRKPLVWDVLMSIYLIAVERKLDQWSRTSRATLGVIRRLERIACRLPDLLLLDTPEYVSWFHSTHGIAPERFKTVPLGADDRLFSLEAGQEHGAGDDDGIFRAVYYGAFVPSHGTEYIIEAARLLADDDTIRFDLIGKGGERGQVIELAQSYGLSNVTFPGFVDDSELIRRLRRADVCLASFGTTPHSLITIHNKVFEVLAMARPLIIGDAPALRRFLEHGRHIYLCQREHAQSLTAAIRALREDPELCATLSQDGHDYYQRHFAIDRLGLQLEQHLCELLARTG